MLRSIQNGHLMKQPYNTNNKKQYRPTEYLNDIKFNDNDLIDDFVKLCNDFEPDIIFGRLFRHTFMVRESM